MTREEAIDFAEFLKNNWIINFPDMEKFCDRAIEALQAEPVKHGEWENHGNEWLTCSLCDWESAFHYDFCPNCGAKMDKK